MCATRILEKVEATARQHQMLGDASGIVLGVSGGPDSLALLHLMGELRDKCYPQLRLYAGHLHHGMRGRIADEDAEFVCAQCAELNVTCSIEHANVPRLAHDRGVGEEVAGRDARYEFLVRLAGSHGADRIGLGHHAGDQAETILMRALRGAGPRGMGGIPYVRRIGSEGNILVVRPLLDCSRAEIELFLRERNLNAHLDATNLSPKYLRNRIRMQTLPALEREWGSDLRGRLCAFANTAQRLYAQAQRIRERLEAQQRASVQNEYVEAEADWLRTIPDSFQPELIRHWLRSGGLWVRTLDRAHYERISTLLDERCGSVTLPGDVIAACSGKSFILCRAAGRFKADFKAELRVPGVTVVEPLHASLDAGVLQGGMELLESGSARVDPFEELLDMDCLKPPLAIRFQRPGDRMKPLGAPGHRKLQDILMDLHIPKWKRGRIPLVTMGDKPIWIVGVRLADCVKLTAKTRRVLRLRFQR